MVFLPLLEISSGIVLTFSFKALMASLWYICIASIITLVV